VGPGGIPDPPPCSDAQRISELSPQAVNVPCSGKQGNLLFRTVCASPGFNQASIVLPAGRAAGCFAIEAITRNRVTFGIRAEGGPDVYRSSQGPGALKGLALTDSVPSPSGKYTVFIDIPNSDPGAAVTLRFVDHPK